MWFLQLLAFTLTDWSRTGILRNDWIFNDQEQLFLHALDAMRVRFFILIHFFTVLFETTTRNGQIWSRVENFMT